MSLHAEKNILNDYSIFRKITIRQSIFIILSEQLLTDNSSWQYYCYIPERKVNFE